MQEGKPKRMKKVAEFFSSKEFLKEKNKKNETKRKMRKAEEGKSNFKLQIKL